MSDIKCVICARNQPRPGATICGHCSDYLETRFWRHIFAPLDSECWLWTASVNVGGYGRLADKNLPAGYRLAHRFSYELHYGSIPRGMIICHRCDVPRCVNPEHLFIGTDADNMRDMIAKGRHRGASATHCKRGHEFNSENTHIARSGQRICRECTRVRRRKGATK